MHLYSWDGQTLQEAGQLEGSKVGVTSLAYSPDGSLIAAGYVRWTAWKIVTVITHFASLPQSSGKIVLFDVKEKK